MKTSVFAVAGFPVCLGIAALAASAQETCSLKTVART